MKTPIDDDLIARIASAEARLRELSRKTLSTLTVTDPTSNSAVLQVQPDKANGSRPQITIRDTSGGVLFQNDTGGSGWGLRAPLRIYNGAPTGLTFIEAYGSDTAPASGSFLIAPTTSQRVRLLANAYIHNASGSPRTGTFTIQVTFTDGSSWTTIDSFTIVLPNSPSSSNASQLRDITYTYPSNVFDSGPTTRFRFQHSIDSNPSGFDAAGYVGYMALALPS